MLLNIGPMGNGKIDPKDVAILDGIGAWMKVNGESIHGTDAHAAAGAGLGRVDPQGQHALPARALTGRARASIVVGGLKSPVKRAYLLADPGARRCRRSGPGELDLVVQGPARAPDPTDTVIALELDGEPVTDPTRLLSTDVPVDTLRAFDGKLQGGLDYGAGKARDAYVLRAGPSPTDSVRWPVRLREPATFEVADRLRRRAAGHRRAAPSS